MRHTGLQKTYTTALFLMLLICVTMTGCSDHEQKTPVANHEPSATTVVRSYNDLIKKPDGSPDLTVDDIQIGPVHRSVLNTYSKQQVLQFFQETALSCEYTDGDTPKFHNIVKWVEPVISYSILGENIDPDILDAIYDTFTTLSSIPGIPAFIQLSDNDGTAMILLHVGTNSSQKLLQEYDANGFCNIGYDASLGRIIQGQAYFQPKYASKELMTHVVHEEITQLMGLMNDTMMLEDSILYENYSLQPTLSDLDIFTLEMLYSSVIQPNMTEDECLSLLAFWLDNNQP